MFGFVMANIRELNEQERKRYNAVYCGICRRIRMQSAPMARFGLSYDLAFLAILLLSLYEPEEESGDRACGFHPLKPRPWVDHQILSYCADMNVALCYYKALDDYRDEGKKKAQKAAELFGKTMAAISEKYPRQCCAIEEKLQELSRLETDGCQNPDLPAGCFGALMGELFVYQEDLWSDTLRKMGEALGRFIYLADAAIDYRKDEKKEQYNPFLRMGTGIDPKRWEEYLVLSMGRCAEYYESLPLVQDKSILDNIIYSGIWLSYRRQQRGENKK